MATTIQISEKLRIKLQEAKDTPRQTYEELILEMITVFERIKKNNEYDKFLHNIQKNKMKELWDNKKDEVWENA